MGGRFIDATLRLIDNFTRPLGNAVSQMEQGARQFQRAGKQIEKAGAAISSVGSSMVQKVTVPLAGLGATAVKTAADFEKSMDAVAAVMVDKLKPEDLDKLTQKAQEMGKKTKYSASDSADAFLMFAQAGWDTQKMLDNIEGMMYLAGATGTELGNAANYVISAMAGLGEQSGYTAEKIGNNLAVAASSSKTNIDSMGEAFSMISTTVGQMGYSMEDACVILGTLANANYEGAEAGMAFNRIIERMSTNGKALSQLEEMGIALYDEAGKARALSEVFGELREAYGKMESDEERVNATKLLGGQYSTKLQAILGSEQSAWDGLTEAMQDTSGATREMYDVANDNLTGRLTILGSTLESIAITFGERLMPYMEAGVGKLQELADWFSTLSDEQVDQAIKWAGIAAAAGPAVMIFGNLVGMAGKGVLAIGRFGGGLSVLRTNAESAGRILSTIKFAPQIPMPAWLGKIGGVLGGFGGKVTGLLLKPFSLAGNAIAGFAAKSKILGGITGVATKSFGLFGKGIQLLFAPFTKALGIFGAAGKALFTLLGPANSAILVIGLLIAAGILLYKNWDKVSEAGRKLGAYIQSIFNDLGLNVDFFKGKISEFGGKFSEVGQKAQELWVVISPVLGKIGDIAILVFRTWIGAAIGGAIGLFGTFIQTVSEFGSGFLGIMGGIIDFITGVFTGNWEQAWNGVKEIFRGVFDSFVALAKTPINAVIGLINGVVSGINNMGIDIPDWVPGLGGKGFHINIPQIPMLYKGTDNWMGGLAMIHDKGAEIVDLPQGTRVYPHDESIRIAKKEGGKNIYINVAKIAETVIIREEADIDAIMERFGQRLEEIAENTA